jgi:diaminohydroxyphosphoribosylaminopyrimidine deaminase/5-amino-6-(5-phosphoribosylamino)uracil reductase
MSAASDRAFMRLALRLAARGAGSVSPNPMVGCVIVRDGEVIATGRHRRASGDHAEADALRGLDGHAEGCDLFVTLEPCCHTGKRTPPCVPAIVAARPRRVVVGSIDPNPQVAGRGVAQLRASGIDVEVGVLGDEAARLNAPFSTWVRTGRPLVILKLAATLDGRIADRDGASRWVSSEASRRQVQRLRAASDAVMIGAGTARADDPTLLPRGVRGGRTPLRVVLDGRATLSPDSNLVRTAARGPVLVATRTGADAARVAVLRAAGVEILELPGTEDRVDAGALLDELGRRAVTSVLVEGGSELAASLLREKRVDRIVLFLAPRLLGDPGARPLTSDLGLRRMAETMGFQVVRLARSGPDVRIDLEPAK